VADDCRELLTGPEKLALPVAERSSADSVRLEQAQFARALADLLEQPLDLALMLDAIDHYAASSSAGTSPVTSTDSVGRHSMTSAESTAASSEMPASA